MIHKIFNGQKTTKGLYEADHHHGSLTGLHPKNAKLFNGVIYTKKPQNKIQRWLWRNRLDDLSVIGKVDYYAHLGDTVEGLQQKVFGRTLVSANLNAHKEWAVESIQIALDLCKPKVFIGTNGTPYHVSSSGMNIDEDVFNALKSQNPNIDFIIGDNPLIKIGELVYGFAHPYPTTQFKTPPLEKLINQHGVEYYLGNTNKINVFVRGHAHTFIWLKYRGDVYAFVVPCQQPTSSYARQKAYLTVRTVDVGLLLVTQVNKTLMPMPFLHKWKD